MTIMNVRFIAVLLILTIGDILFANNTILTDCRQVSDKTDNLTGVITPFFLTGTVARVSTPDTYHFTISDTTGFAAIAMSTNATTSGEGINLGDIVSASGYLDGKDPLPQCTNIVFLSKGQMPPIKTVPIVDIIKGKYDSHIVKARGVIKHVFQDDIDPKFAFLELNDDGNSIYVPTLRENIKGQNLIGAFVEITGRCHPYGNHFRRHIGRTLAPTKITFLTPAENRPSNIPDISNIRRQGPAEISSLGQHSARGMVIAVWDDATALVKTSNNSNIRVEFTSSLLPECGREIDIIGYPTSDLYNINLTGAYWQYAASTNSSIASIKSPILDWQHILSDRTRFNPSLHGKTVNVKGIVRGLTKEPDKTGLITLDADGHIIQINATAHPEILENVEIGCTVGITGVAIMEIENWRPNATFPKIQGFFIVPKTKGDVIILSHPPWFTPGRLIIILAALLLVITVVLVWNRILKAQVERRTKQLLREQIEGIRTKLKVSERTRIAIELHDTLSQDLAGVTFELDAARNLIQNTDEMVRHLDLATKTLASCRDELRNCLWDLRNNTLGDCDMNEAIRRAIVPLIDKPDIKIRFNVPRSRLTDDTAHAVLRIVRELISNAARHGKASTIRVAGYLKNGDLEFSVKDDGCGFGSEPIPGPAEGHFGLQGIRERIRRYDGKLTYSTDPSGETRVSVSMKINAFDTTEDFPL